MNSSMIHPMLVHFPIALIIVGFLFATLALLCKKCRTVSCDGVDDKRKNCLLKTTFWILSLGALSALIAVCSGYVFTNPMEGLMGTMRQTHICYALTATILSCVAALLYGVFLYTNKNTQKIGYIIYLLAVVMIGLTGHLGGAMVFGF